MADAEGVTRQLFLTGARAQLRPRDSRMLSQRPLLRRNRLHAMSSASKGQHSRWAIVLETMRQAPGGNASERAEQRLAHTAGALGLAHGAESITRQNINDERAACHG